MVTSILYFMSTKLDWKEPDTIEGWKHHYESSMAQFQKDHQHLEKEYQNAQTVIRKSKEARVIQNMMDEMSKLRLELENLGEQKQLNEGLKSSIQSVVAKSETQKIESSSLIESLKKQLVDCGQVPVESAVVEKSTKSEATDGKVLILQAQIGALEKSQTDWKQEKVRLQKVIGNLKSDIEDYKMQVEEYKNQIEDLKSLEKRNSTISFRGSLAVPTNAPSPAISPSASGAPPATTASSVPAVTTTSAIAAARSWWTKGAVNPAPVTTATPQPTANAANPTTSLSGSLQNLDHQDHAAKIKQLESEIESLKTELNQVKELNKSVLPNLPTKDKEDNSAELGKRLNELEVQYAKLKAEKNEFEIKSQELEAQNKILPDLQKTIQVTESRIKELETIIVPDLQKELTSLKSKASNDDELQKTIVNLNSQLTSFKDVEILSKAKDDKIITLETGLSQLKAELATIDSLKESLNQKSSTITTLENEKHSLLNCAEQLKEVTVNYTILETKLTQVQNELVMKKEEFTQNLETMKQLGTVELENQKQLTNQYLDRNNEHEKRIHDLTEDLTNKISEINTLKAKIAITGSEENPNNDKATAVDALRAEFDSQLKSSKESYQKELSLSQEKLQNIQQELITIKKQYDNVIDERNKLDKELQTKKHQNEQAIQQLESQIVNLTKEIAAKSKDIEQANEFKLSNEKKIGELTVVIRTASQQLETQAASVKRLEQELHTAKETNSQSNSTLQAELSKVKEDTEKQLADLHNKHSTEINTIQTENKKLLELQLTNHTTEISAKSKVCDGLEEELRGMKDELSKVKTSSDDLTKKLNTLQTEYDQKVNELQLLSKTGDDASKKISTLQSELDQKVIEIKAITKQSDAYKVEVDKLHKSIATTKESSDFLSKSLQEQIAQLVDSKNTLEKKLKTEFEEKSKKEKLDIEAAFKKERIDLEEKNKKAVVDVELRTTKEKVELEDKFKKEKVKLNQDLDKAKKDYDTMKIDLTKKLDSTIAAKGEELGKLMSKTKTLETELQASKTEQAKLTEQLSTKTNELTKEITAAKLEHEQLVKITADMSTLQGKYDVMVQELDVAQTGYNRQTKLLSEKEDVLKKLKASKEDLSNSEQTLKKNLSKSEKEKESIVQELNALKSEFETSKAALVALKTETDSAREKTLTRINELEVELTSVKEEKEVMAKKLSETDHEHSLTGRKATQLVKDLQKQLARERQKREEGGETNEHQTAGAPENIVSLQQANEALVKRAAYFEEELRSADDRFKNLSHELEQKSKVVQQYILRDHEMALQPEERPKVKFGISVLSSSAAMQRLDPQILSSINMKMQKLLEEMTVKMLRMEDELKAIKGTKS